jgi:hypothetical protein
MKKFLSYFFCMCLVLLGWVGGVRASVNLIPNPDFTQITDGIPQGWEPGNCTVPEVSKSVFKVVDSPNNKDRYLYIKGGEDRAGYWQCQVDKILPHTEYEFEIRIFRSKAINKMYPQVEVFGQRFFLDQVWFSKRVHTIRLRINSGSVSGQSTIRLINEFPTGFWFTRPSLVKAKGTRSEAGKTEIESRRSEVGSRTSDLGSRTSDLGLRTSGLRPFPLGLYGTSVDDLDTIAGSPFNLVRVPGTVEAVGKAHAAGLGCFVRLPHDAKKLAEVIEDFNQSGVAFGPEDYLYIDDEPELRSIAPSTLIEHRRQLHNAWPNTLGIMANVRPQCVADYQKSADVFMMDQYPVPSMPMTWLADSIDEARDLAGPEKEIWAIIQAFGGDAMARHGWPVFPSYEQMRCLTFLSLIHEVKGILYYTYSHVKKEASRQAGLWDIANQVRSLEPWLVDAGGVHRLSVRMTSPFRCDAVGRPAVQAGLMQHGDKTVIMAVNTIDRPVDAVMSGFPSGLVYVDDPFDEKRFVVREGTVKTHFAPWQVRIFVAGNVKKMIFKGKRTARRCWKQAALAQAPLKESGPWF